MMTDIADEGPRPSGEDLLQLVGPQRLVFWGGLICLLDFRVNRFDLLNDVLGMVLITAGVFRLGRIPVARSYSRAMGFVKLVAVLSTIQSFLDQFGIDKPPGMQFLWACFGLVEIAAGAAFCLSRRLVCLSDG